MAHPAFVKIAGQLCYDDVYIGNPLRGKKGMQAAAVGAGAPQILR